VPAALAIAIWLERIVFSLAICSLPLVSDWHVLTTYGNYLVPLGIPSVLFSDPADQVA